MRVPPGGILLLSEEANPGSVADLLGAERSGAADQRVWTVPRRERGWQGSGQHDGRHSRDHATGTQALDGEVTRAGRLASLLLSGCDELEAFEQGNVLSMVCRARVADRVEVHLENKVSALPREVVWQIALHVGGRWHEAPRPYVPEPEPAILPVGQSCDQFRTWCIDNLGRDTRDPNGWWHVDDIDIAYEYWLNQCDPPTPMEFSWDGHSWDELYAWKLDRQLRLWNIWQRAFNQRRHGKCAPSTADSGGVPEASERCERRGWGFLRGFCRRHEYRGLSTAQSIERWHQQRAAERAYRELTRSPEWWRW